MCPTRQILDYYFYLWPNKSRYLLSGKLPNFDGNKASRQTWDWDNLVLEEKRKTFNNQVMNVS